MSLITELLKLIPRLLLEERKRRYPKPVDFASRLGVTRQRLSAIEKRMQKGKGEWATVVRYANALDDGKKETILFKDDECKS